MMAMFSKTVALLALALLGGNAQCMTECTLKEFGPAKTQATHCHHKNNPVKEHPNSVPCSHDITIIESSENTISAAQEQAFVMTSSIQLVAEDVLRSFGTLVETEISPPTPNPSSISVLRI